MSCHQALEYKIGNNIPISVDYSDQIKGSLNIQELIYATMKGLKNIVCLITPINLNISIQISNREYIHMLDDKNNTNDIHPQFTVNNCKEIILYLNCTIINKTSEPIFIKDEKSKIRINSNSSTILYLKSKQIKCKIENTSILK